MNTAAPIIAIYGGEGEGKTTLASKFIKPIWMALEKGMPAGVEADAISDLLTFAHIVEALRELCKDPRDYKTLVVDTLDSLEPLLIEHLAQLEGYRAGGVWQRLGSPRRRLALFPQRHNNAAGPTRRHCRPGGAPDNRDG
jgi:hypothetical protein